MATTKPNPNRPELFGLVTVSTSAIAKANPNRVILMGHRFNLIQLWSKQWAHLIVQIFCCHLLNYTNQVGRWLNSPFQERKKHTEKLPCCVKASKGGEVPSWCMHLLFLNLGMTGLSRIKWTFGANTSFSLKWSMMICTTWGECRQVTVWWWSYRMVMCWEDNKWSHAAVKLL